MKFLAIVALAFGGINSIVLSQGMDQLENAKKVTVILDSYSKHKQLEVFKNIDDPYLQFLTVFNELLTLEDILKESRGFSSRNIGFTGRNGIEYDSGLSPESIDDLVDREAYRKALDVNSENIKRMPLPPDLWVKRA